MVSSAYSFASDRILLASALAFARIRSFEFSSFSFFSRSCFFSSDISLWFLAIVACSCSSLIRVASKSVRTSSNALASEVTRFLASSIISADRPSLCDMANALLLPGTPINRRYVGRRVVTSNSQQAFSTSGVCRAYSFNSL